MENFEQKNNILKIETIKTPEGNEVSCCPERGGIITSLKFNGVEVLYMDDETLKDAKLSVKGGIPILFPNAGPIPDELKTEELKNLKQHGFARESKWDLQKDKKGFMETLSSNADSKKIYPYEFKMKIGAHFEEDESFTITEEVENKEKYKTMPISSGFHPYFKVPTEKKKDIEFNFEGGEYVKENFEKWSNGKAVSVPNPNEPIVVDIPDLGKLVFNISPNYKRIWVWSMADKDFICVEPVMRDKGGIVSDPEKIEPNQTHSASFNISLEKK